VQYIRSPHLLHGFSILGASLAMLIPKKVVHRSSIPLTSVSSVRGKNHRL
jgi:hypothetical protein